MKRRFGGRPLRHSRLQFVLAVAAMGVAVALPVILVSVGGGVAAHEISNLENSGYQLVVTAEGVHGITDAHNYSRQILAVPGVTAASPILSTEVDLLDGSGNATPLLAEGVIPDQFSPSLGPTESGLFPSPLPLGDPTDSVHWANGTYSGPATYDVLVSASLDIQVPSTVVLSPDANASHGTTYNVTGTFGVPLPGVFSTATLGVLLPLSDLQSLTGFGKGLVGEPDAADSVQIVVAGSIATDPAALGRVESQVQSIDPAYSVSSLSEEAQQLQSASGVLTGFYLALSSVGLTVGLLFLALVLLRRVESDRRSIGIRRALGIPGRTIARDVLWNGAELALLGSVAGVVGGILIVEALATWATSAVQEAAKLAVFDPVLLSEIVLGVVALSLLAGAVATRRALRIEISEALR